MSNDANRPGTAPAHPGRGRIGLWLGRWVGWAGARAGVVITSAILMTGGFAYYTATHLRVNTNTQDMISADLPWRQDQVELKRAFPRLARSIVVVVDGPSVEAVEEVRDALALTFGASEAPAREVFVPGGGLFFQRNGLLYMNTVDLEALTDRLAEAQPFLHRLAHAPRLATLASLLGQALGREESGLPLEAFLHRLDTTLAAELEGRVAPMSWQALMLPDQAGAVRRLLLVRDAGTTPRREQEIETITALRMAAAALSPQETGVRVRLTGVPVMEYEELQSVVSGTLVGSLVTLLLVGGILAWSLRSAKLIMATAVTTVVGLIATAAFAAVAVGSLNMISVAFALLYIGLAVDFSIHYCLRYRELAGAGSATLAALQRTAQEIGPSMLICCVTTAIGFYAFVPTEFSGVKQLGIISGTGMFISFGASLTLLPALIQALQPGTAAAPRHLVLPGLGRVVAEHRRSIRVLTVLATVAAALVATEASFDHDPLNLRDPDTESVATFKDLIADSASPALNLSVLADSDAQAERVRVSLEALPEVKRALSLDSLVPADQNAKLALIDDIDMILGGPLPEPAGVDTELQSDLAALDSLLVALQTHLDRTGSNAVSSAGELYRHLRQWRDELRGSTSRQQFEQLRRLADAVLGTLPASLQRLNELLRATPVTRDDLPESIRDRWIGRDARYRVEASPRENVLDQAAGARFVDAVTAAAPRATGLPVVHLRAAETVVGAFETALITAFALITAVLLVLFRNLRDTAVVVFLLLFAALWTGACSVIIGLDFNFANVIVLPLLLGIGVDSAIHMTHRQRSLPPADGNLLATSTGNAVLYSTLTTLCGFGGLALSTHPGTASMGLMLAIGMLMILVASLVVLPAIMGTGRGPRRT